jgi:hypothetical protein
MTFNKIPLAIGYDPATGNASGLMEFILNLSDVGDVCSGTVPTTNQVLAWTGSEACWSSIVFPAGGGGSFDCSSLSACNLSSLGDVCSATPLVGQVLAYSGANGFCYSSINFPASAAPLVSSVNGETGDIVLTLDEINAATNTSFAANGTLTVANASKFTVAGNSGDVTVGNVTIIRGADGDIEAGKDVVIGQTSFTQTSAKIANVGENSLVITDPTSSVSSVSGASGTIPYFTGDTPKPVLTGIDTILNEKHYTITPGQSYATAAQGATADAALPKVGGTVTGDITLNGGDIVMTGSETVDGVDISARDAVLTSTSSLALNALPTSAAGSNEIYYKNGATPDGLATTTGSRTFIGSDAKVRNLADVADSDPNDGQILQFRGSNYSPVNLQLQFGESTVGGLTAGNNTYIASNVVLTPPGTTGKGDSTANSFLFFSGTDASATEFVGDRFGRAWVTGPDQDISDGNYLVYLSANDTTSGTAATELHGGLPQVIHREVGAPVASSNSTSLAELVSYTLPANHLALGDIDIMIRGRQLAQGSNLRWNFKIAGTNILNSSMSQGTFSDFTRYTMHIQISKMATDRQMVTARFVQGTGTGSAAVT